MLLWLPCICAAKRGKGEGLGGVEEEGVMNGLRGGAGLPCRGVAVVERRDL